MEIREMKEILADTDHELGMPSLRNWTLLANRLQRVVDEIRSREQPLPWFDGQPDPAQVEMDEYADAQVANEEAIADGEHRYRESILGDEAGSSWDSREPKGLHCDCGATVHLDGDTQCPKCGQWFNGVGQALDRHAMRCSLYAQGVDCGCGEG